MTALLLALRLVHVVLGAIWVGFVVFTTFFLAPAVQDAGAPGGTVMGALQRRGIMTVLPILAFGTLFSGVWLYWLVSDGFSAAYAHSRLGMTFGIGGALSILAFIIGVTIMRPAMMRSMTLAQSLGPSPSDADRAELQRLRARGATAGKAVTVLLLLATAAMAVARYL